MRRSRQLLVALVAANAANGFVAPGVIAGDSLPTSLSRALVVTYCLLQVGVAVMIYCRCQADLSKRKIRYPAGVPILVGAFFPVGLPIYFFATRSALAAVIDLATAALYVAACFVFCVAEAYLFLRLFA